MQLFSGFGVYKCNHAEEVLAKLYLREGWELGWYRGFPSSCYYAKHPRNLGAKVMAWLDQNSEVMLQGNWETLGEFKKRLTILQGFSTVQDDIKCSEALSSLIARISNRCQDKAPPYALGQLAVRRPNVKPPLPLTGKDGQLRCHGGERLAVSLQLLALCPALEHISFNYPTSVVRALICLLGGGPESELWLQPKDFQRLASLAGELMLPEVEAAVWDKLFAHKDANEVVQILAVAQADRNARPVREAGPAALPMRRAPSKSCFRNV